jgi:arginase
MAEAAMLSLPYPEVAVIRADTLAAQSLELASVLPERPLVLGGCCCAHVGAVEGLAGRGQRLAVVWIDAHGDLNTPETSPSGNEWGMPLRMLIDDGTVRIEDVALVGARSLDPPEREFIERTGLALEADGARRALEDVDAVYVALDLDVLDPDAGVPVFVPEPEGWSLEEVEELLSEIASRSRVAGLGLTGLVPSDTSVAALERCCRALGL